MDLRGPLAFTALVGADLPDDNSDADAASSPDESYQEERLLPDLHSGQLLVVRRVGG